jgi:hypothetical protein
MHRRSGGQAAATAATAAVVVASGGDQPGAAACTAVRGYRDRMEALLKPDSVNGQQASSLRANENSLIGSVLTSRVAAQLSPARINRAVRKQQRR